MADTHGSHRVRSYLDNPVQTFSSAGWHLLLQTRSTFLCVRKNTATPFAKNNPIFKLMKNFFLTFAAITTLFAGCSQEPAADGGQTPDTTTPATQALRFTTAKLHFASTEELDATIMEVAMMTPAEKQAWEASHEGFVSMNTAARKVGEQMRQLVGKAEALALREAYSELFIFDPNQEVNSLIPLYKSNRLGYANVCNAYGEVEVAGQTINMNTIARYEETWLAKATRESQTETRGTRQVNSVRVGTPAIFLSLLATSDCSIVAGRAVVFARYVGEWRNGSWISPAEVSYTVSYVQGITNNSVISNFDTAFNYYKLQREGDFFTAKTTKPDCINEEIVGFANTTYSTGYKLNAGNGDGILFFQNY